MGSIGKVRIGYREREREEVGRMLKREKIMYKLIENLQLELQ